MQAPEEPLAALARARVGGLGRRDLRRVVHGMCLGWGVKVLGGLVLFGWAGDVPTNGAVSPPKTQGTRRLTPPGSHLEGAEPPKFGCSMPFRTECTQFLIVGCWQWRIMSLYFSSQGSFAGRGFASKDVANAQPAFCCTCSARDLYAFCRLLAWRPLCARFSLQGALNPSVNLRPS